MTTDATKPAQGRILFNPSAKRLARETAKAAAKKGMAMPAEKVSMIAAPISALPTEPT